MLWSINGHAMKRLNDILQHTRCSEEHALARAKKRAGRICIFNEGINLFTRDISIYIHSLHIWCPEIIAYNSHDVQMYTRWTRERKRDGRVFISNEQINYL
jgi:hypothetical protein